jgi:hypothetical protein
VKEKMYLKEQKERYGLKVKKETRRFEITEGNEEI